MSSFERGLRFLALGLAALALSGCIEPMYGPLSATPMLAEEMKTIEVAPIDERRGVYLRNELIFALNGTGSQVPPRYRLIVKLGEQARTPIIDTVTGRATSATVIVHADYRLITLPDEQEVRKGVAFSYVSYDRFSNRLANVRAARDAETRDVKAIADEIRTQLSTTLSERLRQ